MRPSEHGRYPGQEGGRAIAETIFGESNPSAKLTQTWHAHRTPEPGVSRHERASSRHERASSRHERASSCAASTSSRRACAFRIWQVRLGLHRPVLDA